MSWKWTDHACRNCGSRLVERRDGAHALKPLYECGSCGAKAAGEHTSICGCGILPKSVRSNGGPRLHCTVNPTPGPANLSIIMIAFDEVSS